MEKTGQMIEFEEETGQSAIVTVKVGFAELQFPSEVYVEWIEAELLKASVKAAQYGRLMSGGNKTLKEWANIFGMPVAVDQNGEASCFVHVPVPVPVMYLNADDGIWTNSPENYGEETYLLPPDLIDFNGDWKDSLTLPDGWEEK
jgi:hypothetical protein